MAIDISLNPLVATIIAFFFPFLSNFLIFCLIIAKWSDSSEDILLMLFMILVPLFTFFFVRKSVKKRFVKLGYAAFLSYVVTFGVILLADSSKMINTASKMFETDSERTRTIFLGIFCIFHAINYLLHFVCIAISKNDNFVKEHLLHWLHIVIYILSAVEYILEVIYYPEMKKSIYISCVGLIAFGVFTFLNVVSFRKLSRENDSNSICFSKLCKTHVVLVTLTIFAGQLLLLNPISLVLVPLFGMKIVADLRSNQPNVDNAEAAAVNDEPVVHFSASLKDLD